MMMAAAGQPYSQNLNAPVDPAGIRRLIEDTHAQLAVYDEQARQARFGLNNPNGDTFTPNAAGVAPTAPTAPGAPPAQGFVTPPSIGAPPTGGFAPGSPVAVSNPNDALLATLLAASQRQGMAGNSPQASPQNVPQAIPTPGSQPLGANSPGATATPVSAPLNAAGARPLNGQAPTAQDPSENSGAEKPLSLLTQAGALVAAPFLAAGATRTLDALEARSGGVMPQHSALAQVARGLSQNRALEGINTAIEERMALNLTNSDPGWRQSLLLPEKALESEWSTAVKDGYSPPSDLPKLWNERADVSYLAEELKTLETGLEESAKQVGENRYQYLKNQGIEDFLLKPPSQWTPINQRKALRQLLAGSLNEFTPQQLATLVQDLPSELNLPEWLNSYDLEAAIAKEPAKAKAWLRSQFKGDVNNANIKHLASQAFSESTDYNNLRTITFNNGHGTGKVLNDVLADLASANPNNAKRFTQLRVQLSTEVQETLATHLKQPERLLKALKQFHKTHPLFGVNGWHLGTPSQQSLNNLDDAKRLLTELINKADDSLPKTDLLAKLDAVTNRLGLEEVMKGFEGSTQSLLSRNTALLQRIEGFFDRSNQTLATHHLRYYDDLARLDKMQDMWGARQAEVNKLLKKHNLLEAHPDAAKAMQAVFDEVKAGTLPAEEWLSALKNRLPLWGIEESLKATISSNLDDVAVSTASIKPITGLGRLWFKAHQDVRRLFSGEFLEDAAKLIPHGKQETGNWLHKLVTGEWMGSFGKYVNVGLLLVPVITETAKADAGFDKVRSFSRELVGGFLGFWGAAQIMSHAMGAFKLAPKWLQGWSSKPTAFFGVKGGGLLLFVGSTALGIGLSWLGKKATDIVLLGKPKHILREEAKAKAEQQNRQAGLPAPDTFKRNAPQPTATQQSSTNNPYAAVPPGSPLADLQADLPAAAIANSRPSPNDVAFQQAMKEAAALGGLPPGTDFL